LNLVAKKESMFHFPEMFDTALRKRILKNFIQKHNLFSSQILNDYIPVSQQKDMEVYSRSMDKSA
jgi:hypothetical protein